MDIGILGLGAMGKAVAANVLAAGLRTTVWNRSPGPVAELAAKGARAAADAGDAFGQDVVLSLLFDDAAVRATFLDGDVLSRARPGAIHVCMSTISTTLARELVRAHEAAGIAYVGAPMFGRPDAAVAAKLNIVTAGASSTLDAVEPVLSVLGRTWRMGNDPAMAHLAKIAGNFMIGCAIETMAESAGLISAQGGDPAPFLAMMGETLFAAPIYRSYGAAIASGVSPGAPSGLQLPLKDVGLTLNEAGVAGTRAPLAELVQGRMQAAVERGFGDDDWSVALAKVARS